MKKRAEKLLLILLALWLSLSSAQAAWYDNNWTYRVKVTVEDEKVGSNETNFPVMIDLNDLPDDFWNNVKSDGTDIVVTDSGGSTKLQRELESINTTTNAGILWFKAASLSSTSNSDFYVYYGNTSGAESNSTSVWTDNYAIVSHLHDTPTGSSDDIDDSTNNYEGDSFNMGAGNKETGKIGGALYIDDNDPERINYGSVSEISNVSTYSFSFWVSSVYYIALGQGSDSIQNLYYDNMSFYFYPTNYNDYGYSSPSFSGWNHVVAVYDGGLSGSSRYKLYIDGSEQSWDSTSGDADSTTGSYDNNFLLGKANYSGYDADAIFDEFRLATSALSASWIQTEYNNQNSPSTFYNVAAAEENSTDIVPPAVTNLSPADNSTYVIYTTNLVMTFNDNIDIQTGNLYIKQASDDSIAQTISVTSATGNGTSIITFDPADLAYNTAYYIEIENGALFDDAGNNYAGFTTNGTWNFTTAPETGTWHDNNWTYRHKITIPASEISSDLTNFPVLLDLNGLSATFWENVKSDGSDMLITDQYATKLSRDLENINTTTNQGVFWFEANSLSSTSNNDFYLYFGNVSASETTTDTATWTDSYAIVSHLSDTPSGSSGDIDDSTDNHEGDSKNGMNAGSSKTGKIHKALHLAGNSQRISYGSVSEISNTDTYSYSLWVSSVYNYVAIGEGNNSIKNLYYDSSSWYFYPTNYNEYGYEGFSFSGWHHIVAVFNGNLSGSSRYKLYIDGSERSWDSTNGNADATTGSGEANLLLGYDAYNSYNSNAIKDEFRVATVALSADWISTEYDNQNDPNSFYTVASVEINPVDVVPPQVTSYSPVDNSTGVSYQTNLVMTFDDTIDLQTGNLYIKRASNDAVAQTIPMTSGAVTGNGTTTLTFNPADLLYNVAYYIEIDNGAFFDDAGNNYPGITANGTWNFTTAPRSGTWDDGDWEFRQKITIPASSVNGDLVNFPVMVDLSDMGANFWSNVKADGGDIKVTDAVADNLNRELEYIDGSPDEGILWFKSVNLSSTSNNDFYIYYGNASASETNDTATWSSEYAIVSHLNDTPTGSADDIDDSVNNYEGDSQNSMDSDNSQPGKIHKAIFFEGNSASQYINYGSVSDITNVTAYSYSFWVSSVYNYVAIGEGNNSIKNLYYDGTSWYFYPTDYNSSGDYNTSLSGWNYMVAVYDGDLTGSNRYKLYMDGEPVAWSNTSGNATSTTGSGEKDFLLGRDEYNGYYSNAITDEFRLATGALSRAWIKTEYDNQNAPSSFYEIAAYEIDLPQVESFDPPNGSIEVDNATNLTIGFSKTIDIQTGNLTILQLSDDTVVQTIAVTSGAVSGNGTASITINPPSNLADSTSYYINIDATAFDDVDDGYSYAGIADNGTWVFTTATIGDTTDPTVSTFSPADEATSVAQGTNLVVTFDEAVDVESGDITIKQISDDSVFETIPVGDSRVTGTGTTTITINPNNGLLASTAYYINIATTAFDDAAGNSYAGISNNSTWNFTTAAAGPAPATENASWANSNWAKRIKITVDADQVNGDLSNFPIYVDLNDLSSADFFSFVDSTGKDIRVTQGDGLTLLPTELVSLDNTNNAGELWFKTPHLDASSDMDFYIYYDNPNGKLLHADHPLGKHNVWTNGYVAVYHMNEDPNGDAAKVMRNSVSNQYHGTPSGTMTSADHIAGQVGNGTDLDGSDDYINIGDISAVDFGSNNYELTTWAKHDNTSNQDHIFGKDSDSNGRQIEFRTNGSGGIRFSYWKSGAVQVYKNQSSMLNDTNWHYIGGLRRGNSFEIYKDGSMVGSGTSGGTHGAMQSTNAPLYLGRREYSGFTEEFDGKLDEMRISNKAHSRDWIETEYNNQSSPSTFYSVETNVDLVSGDDGPKITSLIPENRSDRFPRARNLSVTFDESVQAGSGNITIMDINGSTFETIAIGSTTISTDTVTINPGSNLLGDTEYYILIDNGAIQDMSSNDFSGISNTDTWRFKTEGGQSTIANPNNLFMGGD